MIKITQENAVEELLKRVPEIKKSSDWEHVEDELDSPTIPFDHFGTFLLDRITISNDPLNDDVIKRSFDLINEMQLSDDSDVMNLPQVGVFEMLILTDKAVEVTHKLLNKEGMEWFEKLRNFKHKE